MTPLCIATTLVLTELAAIKQLGHAGPWVYESWQDHFQTSVRSNKYPSYGLLAFATAADPTTVAGYDGLVEHGSYAASMIIALLKDVQTTNEKEQGALLDGRGDFSHRIGQAIALRKYVGGLFRANSFNNTFDDFLDDYDGKPWQFPMEQGTMYHWPLAAECHTESNVAAAANALKPYFSIFFLDMNKSEDEMGDIYPFYDQLMLTSLIATAWNRLDKAGGKWLGLRLRYCKEYEDIRNQIQFAKDSVTCNEMAELARMFDVKAKEYARRLKMKIQKGDDERLEEVKATVKEFLEIAKGIAIHVSANTLKVIQQLRDNAPLIHELEQNSLVTLGGIDDFDWL
ncbi:hypothetical protein SCHPADRAFT_895038, partial [Schizopora paradoxa]